MNKIISFSIKENTEYLIKDYVRYDNQTRELYGLVNVIKNKIPKQIKFEFIDKNLRIDFYWLDVLNLIEVDFIKVIINTTAFSSLPTDFFEEFIHDLINNHTLNKINTKLETLSRNSESKNEKSIYQRILSNLGYSYV